MVEVVCVLLVEHAVKIRTSAAAIQQNDFVNEIFTWGIGIFVLDMCSSAF